MELEKRKRVRRDPDTTRTLILDAAERVMVEESHAAVTSRRVAREIGLNAATIHYYYPTIDDLFIALHRRMMDRQTLELEVVLASHNPLQALWKYQSDWDQSALGVEFLVLSSHRRAVGAVISSVTNDARDAQAHVFARALKNARIDPAVISPAALATISIAIARTIANEERVGITQGHEDVRRFVDWVLNHLLKPVTSES